MELLCKFNLADTCDFFTTFFKLPPYYWRGFLGSNLSSTDLVAFALLTFALAPINIKVCVVLASSTACVWVGSGGGGCKGVASCM
jgi:lycopene epsilon-cyclase